MTLTLLVADEPFPCAFLILSLLRRIYAGTPADTATQRAPRTDASNCAYQGFMARWQQTRF